MSQDFYVPRTIKEINPHQDVRVRICGTILKKEEDSALIDDSTASSEVFLNKEDLKNLEEKQVVRIFGRVLPTPDSFELQGEVVQEISGVDRELYQKVQDSIRV